MGAAKKLSDFAVNPDSPKLELPLATRGQRFAAFIIDAVVFNVISALGLALIGKAMRAEGSAFELTWAFAVSFMYYCLPLYVAGTSVGKMALKLQVVPEDPKQEITIGLALKREWFGKAVAGLAFLLGFAMILWDKEQKSWYDKRFKLKVVSTR